ncbi:MAG: APC family permease [Gammaproteobacteria bacterium]
MTKRDTTDDRGIGYWEAVSIGVGGMVGGGIFAVLGLAVQLSGGGTAVAFALAGLIALLTAYSYARLSVTLPSQGGTVTFLNTAFGTGVFTGSLNVLLWLSYIVMLSLYAYAFGSYGATFFPAAAQPFWKHLLISACVLAVAGLNLLKATLIGEAEDWVVGMKVVILLVFIGVGMGAVDPARLAPATWSPALALAAGGMVIFVAYEGFELIANTARDVRNPDRILPRAYFSAVGFVVALYVLVAIVTVGNLPLTQIEAARDYALAQAARPFLGHWGFVLIVIAALLSTVSAINATMYGAARLSYIIARDGELPEVLERKLWRRPVGGLLITVVATLLTANLLDLTSISTVGSAGFLLIFAAVNWANVRLAQRTASRAWVSGTAAVACLAALATLLEQTLSTAPRQLWVVLIMLALAFGIEAAYRRWSGRAIHVAGRP